MTYATLEEPDTRLHLSYEDAVDVVAETFNTVGGSWEERSAAVAVALQDHLGGQLARRRVSYLDGRGEHWHYMLCLPGGDPCDVVGPYLQAPVTLSPRQHVSRHETLTAAGDSYRQVRAALIQH